MQSPVSQIPLGKYIRYRFQLDVESDIADGNLQQLVGCLGERLKPFGMLEEFARNKHVAAPAFVRDEWGDRLAVRAGQLA